MKFIICRVRRVLTHFLSPDEEKLQLRERDRDPLRQRQRRDDPGEIQLPHRPPGPGPGAEKVRAISDMENWDNNNIFCKEEFNLKKRIYGIIFLLSEIKLYSFVLLCVSDPPGTFSRTLAPCSPTSQTSWTPC